MDAILFLGTFVYFHSMYYVSSFMGEGREAMTYRQ
jgi:hypothetical protein